MIKNEEFKKYEELINKQKYISDRQTDGFIFLYPKNTLKKVLGFSCLTLAIIPNGLGVVLYPISFMLLKINKIDMLRHKDKIRQKIKCFLKLNLVICNTQEENEGKGFQFLLTYPNNQEVLK